MDSPTGDFIKSSVAYTSPEFSAMENEKQQQQFSSQFFQDLQQQQTQTQAEQQQQQQRRTQTKPRRSPKSPSSAYSAWARSQAMASVYILVAGGILCLFFPEWLSGAYSIVLGILVYFIEQKPSSNQSSTGGPHASQILSPSSLLPSTVLKAHSIRSTFYTIASVPCFLRAPNYTGGLCLITSGLTYAVAAILASQKSKGKGNSPSMSRTSYR
ncbi:hypothetical protein BKA57DRAFT_538969 [Linnemannia elongata]|nr:hypothetical protein BKA57DRAFT_538969 [Linnemannia elongata]